MRLVKARPAEVAKRTGVHPSTVIRIRDRAHRNPDGRTIELLNRWAAEKAAELGLSPTDRLTWDHLIDGEVRA